MSELPALPSVAPAVWCAIDGDEKTNLPDHKNAGRG